MLYLKPSLWFSSLYLCSLFLVLPPMSNLLLDLYCGLQRLHQSPTALQLPRRRTDTINNNLLTMQESTGKFWDEHSCWCHRDMHYPAQHYCRPRMPSQRNMTKRFHVSGALDNLDTRAPWCASQLFSFFIVFFTRLHAPALYFSVAHVSAIFEHDKVRKP